MRVVSFGRFEGSKFDLREQTLVCKVHSLRSSRFVIFGFVPSLAFTMHQFFREINYPFHATSVSKLHIYITDLAPLQVALLLRNSH